MPNSPRVKGGDVGLVFPDRLIYSPLKVSLRVVHVGSDCSHNPLVVRRILHLVVHLQKANAFGLKVPDQPQPQVVPPSQLCLGGDRPLCLDEPVVSVNLGVVIRVGVGVDSLRDNSIMIQISPLMVTPVPVTNWL